ncbi:MAG: hypothetical protein ACE5GD_01575 [Candidatus Geothermarchaeales archaeon]
MDNVKISGFVVLFIGVIVLLFTFYNAYLFLFGASVISPPPDLMAAFSGALAPLIETCIRAIYLGIMGWIGSILTRRGVQTLTIEREEVKSRETKKTEKTEKKVEADPKAEKEQAQG